VKGQRDTRGKVAPGGRSERQGPAEDGFLRGHQVARVLGIAIPLVMILVWWGIWGDHGEVRSVSETTAVVIRDEGRTCLVRVATGEEVRVFRPANAREGMTVRMTRTEYRSGELRFDLITRSAPDAEAMTSASPDTR
jgi:hypothetical protein